MSRELQKMLYTTAAMTFEELAFVFPTPEMDQQQQTARLDASVSVQFSGPINGRLVVKVYGNLLPTIAANMLGQEEAPCSSQQYDALGEIGNVICGNILPKIAGAKAVFHLSPPQIIADVQSDHIQSPAAEAQIGLEGGRACLLLFLDGEAQFKEKR